MTLVSDPILDARIVRGRAPARTPPASDGAFVLYWMRVAARGHENPALDAAIVAAHALDRPLLVYQAVSERYPYASDRHHTMLLEGARDVAAELAARGLRHVVHVERPGARGPVLRQLAEAAALVVTERMPVAPLDAWTEALRAHAPCPVWEVDASCVVPLSALDRAPTRAFTFRDATKRWVAAQAEAFVEPRPERVDAYDGPLPFAPVDLARASIAELVAEAEIDHGVAPIADTRGGSVAGYARWEAFRAAGWHRYAARRNDPLEDATSRMSPYLHYGHVSPFRLVRALRAAARDPHAEKLLDELLVWREVAWHLCHHRADHATIAALPAWARETLAAHAGDRRPARPSWATLADARSGDPLWDAAQRSLVVHGELHNNVRMTWGKKLLEWTDDAAHALAWLLDLNHRFALDGRDPASIGGLTWCLGVLDRPFPPERPIVGTVRPRPTEEHAERLDVAAYARFVARPAYARRPRVAIVGAGLAGLAAAQTLDRHGLEVVVFDRGHRPGGRLTTKTLTPPDVAAADVRRFDAGPLDFGARSPAFRARVEAWVHDGLAARLDAPRVVVDADGRERLRAPRTTPRWVVAPSAGALAAALAAPLTCHAGTEIVALRRAGDTWWLDARPRDDADGVTPHGPFDVVLFALPAPQLARIAGVPNTLTAPLAPVRYGPTYVVGLALDRPLELGIVEVEGADVERVVGGALRGTARDVVVGYGAPGFSAEALTRGDDDATRTALVEATCRVIGREVSSVRAAKLHRWSLARVEQAAAKGHVFDAALGLGVASDGLLGPRLEAAWTSGVDVAGALLRALAAEPAPSREAALRAARR